MKELLLQITEEGYILKQREVVTKETTIAAFKDWGKAMKCMRLISDRKPLTRDGYV